MNTPLLSLVALGVSTTSSAAVHTEAVEYVCGDATLEGYLAYDDGSDAKRPGVLVVHEWLGLNDYAKLRARQLAELGYVAFAADMYGKGVLATDRAEAGQLAGQFRANWDEGGRALMRERAQAGLQVLARHPLVNAERLAAIGYCFGGTVALEVAYSGADLAGVVSFHGGLTVPEEADLANIKAGILICHGAADSSIKAETIAQLQAALDSANVNWQMIYYAGALHGFTNPGNAGAYNQKAADRSWGAMAAFLAEVLR